MKEKNFKYFKQSLSQERKSELLEHFNTIYECHKLGEHELKIAYLAHLWENGYVYAEQDGFPFIDEHETGINMDEYEITIEAEDAGGVNLDLLYSFYDFDSLIKPNSMKVSIKGFNYEKFEKTILEFEKTVTNVHPTYAVVWMEKNSKKVNFGPEEGRDELYKELQEGKQLFFPFSSSNVDGEFYAANNKTYLADGENELIGDVDCFGYLISFKDDVLDISTAIHYGGGCGFCPNIDEHSCGELGKDMRLFLNKFLHK